MAAALHLSFERGRSGETTLRVKSQPPPWRVLRGFPAPSGETLAHVHNVSGGIFDTDSLSCRIEVAPRAQAQVTTTGATRLYRSRAPERIASQDTHLAIGADGYFEFVPDQVIPFAGSRFVQNTRIELQRGASLIWWERFAPGREASGESFRFESLASRLEIISDGERAAIECWTLTPLNRRPDSLARLGPFRHFASCYVCRAGEPAAYWKAFEGEMQKAVEDLSSPEILWGVTCLRAHGLVIRGVSVSGRRLAETWVQVWSAAKCLLCGRAAAIPRKVH